jgi:hypothetical protein
VPFLLIALLAFVGLVWLGRQARSGKLKRGPWLKQGRAVSGFVALIVGFGGYVALTRGLVLPGAIMIGIALLWLFGLKANLRVVAEKTGAADFLDFRTREALNVLGVPRGADKATIIAAWREKMKTAHPDAGGSEKDAARLNAARDHLLKAFK